MFPIDVLVRVGKLNIHVGIDTDESAFVLGLSPFQTDYNLIIDPVRSLVRYFAPRSCSSAKIAI
jgi:hypothetical protein